MLSCCLLCDILSELQFGAHIIKHFVVETSAKQSFIFFQTTTTTKAINEWDQEGR